MEGWASKGPNRSRETLRRGSLRTEWPQGAHSRKGRRVMVRKTRRLLSHFPALMTQQPCCKPIPLPPTGGLEGLSVHTHLLTKLHMDQRGSPCAWYSTTIGGPQEEKDHPALTYSVALGCVCACAGSGSQLGSGRDSLPPHHCPPPSLLSGAVTPQPTGAALRKSSIPTQAQRSPVHAIHDSS